MRPNPLRGLIALSATRRMDNRHHVNNAVVVPRIGYTIWAVVGQYRGQEDNRFFEERDGELVEVGAQSIHAGEVVPLDATVIHSIRNPSSDESCFALHVYGGDLIGSERSFWEPETGTKKSARSGEMQAAIERLNG